jgi:hypothetical protein
LKAPLRLLATVTFDLEKVSDVWKLVEISMNYWRTALAKCGEMIAGTGDGGLQEILESGEVV